jgi:hypothetical protein
MQENPYKAPHAWPLEPSVEGREWSGNPDGTGIGIIIESACN